MQKSTEHPSDYLWVKLADGRNVPCPDTQLRLADMHATYTVHETHGFPGSLAVMSETNEPVGWIKIGDCMSWSRTEQLAKISELYDRLVKGDHPTYILAEIGKVLHK